MPTITIRNGQRTLKLTKRELDSIELVRSVCLDIEANYNPLDKVAGGAAVNLAAIVSHIEEAAHNGKPAETLAK